MLVIQVDAQRTYRDSAQSTVEITDTSAASESHYVTTNRRFSVNQFRVYDEPNDDLKTKLLIVRETFRNDVQPGVEGSRGHVTAEVSEINRTGKAVRLWSTSADANDGSVFQEQFYRMVQWGCCDSPPIYNFYHLYTGKRVFTSVSNSPLAEVSVVDAFPVITRYASFGFENRDYEVGLLQYGSERYLLQTVKVLMPKGDEFIHASTLIRYKGQEKRYPVIVSGDKREPASHSISGFEVVVEFGDGTKLIIPVENDRLLVTKATLPSGFRVGE